MGILISGAWLFLLGVLGASGLIIAKKPNAKELIDKIVPYQGWFGAVSSLWGIWVIINSILQIKLLSLAPILWISYFGCGVVQFGLGIILGAGILKTFLKKPEVQEKINAVVKKLLPYQGILGIISICLGIWSVIIYFVPSLVISMGR